jgi:hypothetical protein
MTDDRTGGEADAERFAQLSRDLLDATRAVAAVPDAERRSALQRRLIAITNAAKHDVGTAARRLSALLAELGSGPPPGD